MNKKAIKKKKTQPSNTLVPIVLLVAVFVLILSFAVITLMDDDPAYTDQDDIPRVSVAEAKQALDSSEAVFVDVRSVASYNESHIPGSINIPIDQVEGEPDLLNPLDWIITYCT